MTDTETRLRAALHEIADTDAPAPRPVEMPRFRRKRAQLIGAYATAVVVVAAGAAVGVDGFVGRDDSTHVSSQRGDDQLPQLSRVTCLPHGEMDVDPQRVATSRDGVHLQVTNSSGRVVDFSVRFPDGHGVGERASATPSTMTVTGEPGDLRLLCADPFALYDTDAGMTLTVVDRDGYYQEVDPHEVLGCAFTGEADGPTTSGATGEQAARAWVDTYRPDATLTPAAGYVGDPERDFLLDSGVERGVLEIFRTDSGQFTAGLGSVC
jgi:hypothetical protein